MAHHDAFFGDKVHTMARTRAQADRPIAEGLHDQRCGSQAKAKGSFKKP